MRAGFFLVIAATVLTPLTATAQSHPWQARLGLTTVRPHDSSAMVSGTTSGIGVGSGSGLELAINYTFLPEWAVELEFDRAKLDFDVTSQGAAAMSAGDATLGVTTLAFQYRFFTPGRIHPYLGLGAHLAAVSGFQPSPALVASNIAGFSFSRSASLTLLAGVDYDLTERLSVNADLRFHDVATDVTPVVAGGSNWDNLRVDIDPWVFAIGVAYRF
jgi:outer membrane protein